MKIDVSTYQEDWPTIFQKEKLEIRKIIGTNEVAVHHIGSTSVPHLKAKPIIDILLVVNNLAHLDDEQAAFQKLGYEYMGEFGLPGRRYMRKGRGRRTHQIHAYQFDSVAEIQRHLAFRNFLRKHPKVAEDYGLLKAELAKKYPYSIEDYGNGKDDFIKHFEAEALKELWREA